MMWSVYIVNGFAYVPLYVWSRGVGGLSIGCLPYMVAVGYYGGVVLIVGGEEYMVGL